MNPIIETIADFAPESVEAGVGLALRDEVGRYLFFLAGSRHRCPPGELFYAGIGGHREPGESWLACAQREAGEEIGTAVEILAAKETWFVPRQGYMHQVDLLDRPRPLALYEMVHPPHTPRAGELYRLVIYEARLLGQPAELPPDEIAGVIALTKEQVIRGLKRRPTWEQLQAEGAFLVAGDEALDPQVQLYPIGTAAALARILQLLPP